MEKLDKDLLHCYKDQLSAIRTFHRTLSIMGLIKNDLIIEKGSTSLFAPKLVELVSDIFNEDILTKSRKLNIVFARKAAAYILKKYTHLSLKEIAPFIGVNDHTTVLYNIKTAIDLMETENWYKLKIQEVEEHIKDYNTFVQKSQ